MGAIVTLLTDFGTRDSYVAEVKGALLQRVPDATLVDVSHDIPPGDIDAASFVLSRTWHRFPDGTVHLVVVDPGVGTDRRALAASNFEHAFVGPDNGVLSPVLNGAESVELPVPPSASPTFHGRDVFAPAAARLARGDALERLGPLIRDPVVHSPPPLKSEGRAMLGVIVHVDRFGTLVTNLPGRSAETITACRVGDREVGPARRTFADVQSGEVVALLGSGGTVEIAVRDGSAAATLGVGVGAAVRIEVS